MLDALRDGVKYSNGNRAIRHLGIPAVTVPMGDMADKGMPVGLTFAGKAYSDPEILRCAWAYETATSRRTSPPLAPRLDSDVIALSHRPVADSSISGRVLQLTLDKQTVQSKAHGSRTSIDIELSGTVAYGHGDAVEITLFTNEGDAQDVAVQNGRWHWRSTLTRDAVDEKYPVPGSIPRDKFIIVLVAKTACGLSDGIFLLVA